MTSLGYRDLQVDIAALIERGEDQRIEFKRSLNEQTKALQALAAFASQQGGTVVFGISPQGKPVGVNIGANTLEMLVQAIHAEIAPVAAMKPNTSPDGVAPKR